MWEPPEPSPGGQAIRKSMRLTADAMKLAEESGEAQWFGAFFWKNPSPLTEMVGLST